MLWSLVGWVMFLRDSYAGVDLPYMIISDWLGHYVEYMEATPDVEMTRYMQEVVFGPDRKEILKSPL